MSKCDPFSAPARSLFAAEDNRSWFNTLLSIMTAEQINYAFRDESYSEHQGEYSKTTVLEQLVDRPDLRALLLMRGARASPRLLVETIKRNDEKEYGLLYQLLAVSQVPVHAVKDHMGYNLLWIAAYEHNAGAVEFLLEYPGMAAYVNRKGSANERGHYANAGSVPGKSRFTPAELAIDRAWKCMGNYSILARMCNAGATWGTLPESMCPEIKAAIDRHEADVEKVVSISTVCPGIAHCVGDYFVERNMKSAVDAERKKLMKIVSDVVRGVRL